MRKPELYFGVEISNYLPLDKIIFRYSIQVLYIFQELSLFCVSFKMKLLLSDG